MSLSPDDNGSPSNNTRSRANRSARQQHRESLDASADPRRLRRSAPADRPVKLRDTTRRETRFSKVWPRTVCNTALCYLARPDPNPWIPSHHESGNPSHVRSVLDCLRSRQGEFSIVSRESSFEGAACPSAGNERQLEAVSHWRLAAQASAARASLRVGLHAVTCPPPAPWCAARLHDRSVLAPLGTRLRTQTRA